jgi:tripeptide aminopeptidase
MSRNIDIFNPYRIFKPSPMLADNHLVEIFLAVAAIEGVSGAEREVAAFIISFLEDLDLAVEMDNAAEQFGGNSGNVIARIGAGGDTVLMAHMDTAMSTINLKPQRLHDRITSDGKTILGADDRAGVAAILFAVEKLLRENAKIVDCTLAFTVGEERDLAGSRHLQLDPAVKKGYTFDSHLRPGHYIYRTYGAREFCVEVIGEAAHSTLPEKGLNSIKIAAEAVCRLPWGRIDDQTTANIGSISGGTVINTIPETTRLVGEVRSADLHKVDAVIEEIRAAFTTAAEQAGGRTTFESNWGLEPEPVITPGGSDANNLNTKGIPAVNIGIGAQNPHSSEEYILLEDLQKTAEIVQNLIKMD